MSKQNNPRDIKLDKINIQLELDWVEFFGAVARTFKDVATFNLSGGTIPAWFKAVKTYKDKEREAHDLIVNSLMDAVIHQIEERKNITYKAEKYLDYIFKDKPRLNKEIVEKIAKNNYYITENHLSDPRTITLLKDFIPLYQDWLSQTFDDLKDKLEVFTQQFYFHFTDKFYAQLTSKKSKYANLIQWHSNPMVKEWATFSARENYQYSITNHYQKNALGVEGVLLSDVYIEPNFLVFKNIIDEEHDAETRKINQQGKENHFVTTEYSKNIHDYVYNYFLKGKSSQHIACPEAETSRLLILMGQPGHGKSSFCFRCIHDLFQDPEYDAFLIKLQSQNRSFLTHPLKDIITNKKSNIKFEDIIENEDKKTVLFLDGLDEMFMTQSLTDNEVLGLIQTLKNLLAQDKYQHLYVIITSRFNYVESSKLYGHGQCLLLSLDVLDTTQQCYLVDRFKAKKKDEEYKLDSATLEKCNTDSEFEHIKELVQLPILLQMILICNVDIEKEQSRATIYDELFKRVLERKWDEDGQLKKYKKNKLTPEDLREYISFIAYKTYQSNKGYLNKSEIKSDEKTKSFVKDFLRLESSKKGDPIKHVLKDILTSFYLKETQKDNSDKNKKDRDNDYAVEFLHKSLFEYLTCEYIWNTTKYFFLEERKPGRYKNHSTKVLLETIQDIFGNIRLSEELVGYLKEIVKADDEKHDDLLERMSEYLPDLLQYGFLYEYKYQKNTDNSLQYTPDQQAMNAFHGFWCIYGELNQHKIKHEDFMNVPWEDIQKQYLNEASKKELISKFELETEENIKYIQEKSWRIRNIDQVLKNTKLQYQQFQDWITNVPVHENLEKSIQYFQNWSTRQLLSYQANGILKSRQANIQKDHKQIARWLRLIASERLPMKINFAFVPFSQTDFTGLIAPYITFLNADLSNADLSNADLRNADLRNADLRNADLRNAYLRNAYLWNAYLWNAKVYTPDWLEQLANQDIIGYEELIQNYKVSETTSKFTDKWGKKYKAYTILKIDET